jgi:hypothetical protein
MKKLNVGVVGLGQRGLYWVKVLADMENVKVTAVCDVYEDRVEESQKAVEEKCGYRPEGMTDYHDLVDCKKVDAVIIVTAWEAHYKIAIYSMEKGKAVATEVGGAYSVQQCWDLVAAYERTGTPFMFLENCCYGRRELMVMNMVRKGLFGEVVYCKGGYQHDLRKEVTFGRELRHYRLDNYMHRNCENYPTHELGPIANVLNINRGNRMVTLSSSASPAKGLHDYVVKNKSDDAELLKADFKQGDVVVTNIKCANGELITLTLDTTLPRFYTRDFTVRGTNAMYEEATDSVFVDNGKDLEYDYNWRSNKVGNAADYVEEYDHPVWKKYIADGVKGGHDGMDWLVMSDFVNCVLEGKECPIDVYDAAAWSAITALSELSIASGGAPVDIPDFTNGKWVTRAPVDFSL